MGPIPCYSSFLGNGFDNGRTDLKQRAKDKRQDMTMRKGGQKVGRGTYWDLANGSRVHIADQGILPRDDKVRYIRFPSIGVLLLSPIIGLLYVFALPFIVIGVIGRKILERLFNFLRAISAFEWSLNEAHLIGKKKGLQKRKGDQTK